MLGRTMSLAVDGLVKRFGTVIALDGLELEVPERHVFGFLGSNGAGKTTTMRIALGVLRADGGSIRWRGADHRTLPRHTWGYLPEERGLYPKMTVLQQLVFFAGLQGVPRDVATREARSWLARFRVPEFADRRAEELSKGNQQKVQFLAAVLHDPQVLLMDEPFTGLDPVNIVLLREAILELRDRGKTIVLSTHQMETVEAMCESVAIVDHGRTVVAGALRGREALDRPADGAHGDARRPQARVARGRPRGAPAAAGDRAGRDRDRARRRARGRPRSRPRGGGAGDALRGRRPVARAGVHRARRACRGRRSGNGGGVPSSRSGHAALEDGSRGGRRVSELEPLRPESGLRSNAWLVARREFRVQVRSRLFGVSTALLASSPSPSR